MLKLIKNIAIIALASFGVLFLILLFLPEDEEETGAAEKTEIEETLEAEDSAEEEDPEEEEEKSDTGKETSAEEDIDIEEKIAFALEAAAEKEEASSEEETPEEEESSEEDGEAIKFTTYTLDGKKVTEKIFADHDITVVNIWGTFCEPCIAEMEDYASLYKDLPEGVNLIGIVNDVYDGVDSNKEEAEKILNKAGAEFTNLVVSDSIYDVVAPYRYVPSSFFVDSKGHILEALDGAGFDTTKKKLEEYLK